MESTGAEKPGSRFHVEPVQNCSEDCCDAPKRGPPEDDSPPQITVCVIDSNDQTVNSSAYDSHNIRSLLHYTQEALPRMDHYRNIHSLHAHFPRPTLDELHNGNIPSAADQVRIYIYLHLEDVCVSFQIT
ncbi:AA_permease_N domain-containing protein [Caerostris extrusa]|uniref:AA_permease_N domain-containing protein n=1 Tax=Caerostris extrusa TaxID=172846 RepID=A0AAV4NIG7_CAEEX|nr:AA_permease_N domain-containing protein [Caerostris extrusa]